MKLVEAHATNYRNILDSNAVDIGQMTCLVGKNEAGKSAFLKALEGIRSTDPTFKTYDRVTHYPRRDLAEYETIHGADHAVVIRTKWRLEAVDVAALEQELGTAALTSDLIEVYKTYEQAGTSWIVPIDEARVLSYLVSDCNLAQDDMAVLGQAQTVARAHAALATLTTRSGPQEALFQRIQAFRKQDAVLRSIDILSVRMPSFMYFSHWDRMHGELSINKLNTEKQQSLQIASGDQVFLDFLEYAGTTLDELVQTTQFEALNAKCEAAALRITDQIFDYWTQNDELKIKVLLSEGRSGDPAPFNSGSVARARVENNLHGVTVPFSERSAGFI